MRSNKSDKQDYLKRTEVREKRITVATIIFSAILCGGFVIFQGNTTKDDGEYVSNMDEIFKEEIPFEEEYEVVFSTEEYKFVYAKRELLDYEVDQIAQALVDENDTLETIHIFYEDVLEEYEDETDIDVLIEYSDINVNVINEDDEIFFEIERVLDLSDE
ncbi:MAG: hypothetical protein R3Y64_09855 [Peptostreptococcaceae bacterium]